MWLLYREGAAALCRLEDPTLPTSRMRNGRYSVRLFPRPSPADAPELTKHASFSTPSSTCSGEDALGASYPTTSSCPGRVPTITSERGAWTALGSRYMPSCAKGCVAWLAESLLPAPPSLTPKRSRITREVVLAVTTVARK